MGCGDIRTNVRAAHCLSSSQVRTNVRAAHCLSSQVEGKACFVIQAKRSDGPFRIEFYPGSPRTTRVYDEAYERVLRSCDAAALDREAETVLGRIAAEYADVVKAGRDPGDPEYPLWTVPTVIGEEAVNRLSAPS